VLKVNHHKIRKKVTYNIRLDKQFKGKRVYKNILSNRIKIYENNENIMDELENLIKLKNSKGTKAMKKKFDDLCKAKEKKDAKKKKEKEELEKVKNCRKLRKLMNERRTNNDYKFFKDMNIDSQRKILIKLKAVNDFSKIEKPYRIALLESDIPIEFKADAIKKINMLEYMDPGSGEYYKIKNWVDTFMRIPFGKHQNLPITIDDGQEKCQEFMENAKKTLDDAVYGLEDAKMQILQMVGQWISNPQSLGTAIAVKGPPGTGKTTLIKEGVSKILNRPFEFLALGGATDSSYLEGHSYTYEGSMWGKIVDILLNCKCMNPVIYFDELDKISDTPKGEEIVGILTHLTDTTQNDKFHDKYFSNIDFNLSRAMFIFSYNDESKVNPILKDRMYRINTGGYKNEQKCVIANKYLIPRIQKNINFESDQIIIPDETKMYICNTFTDKEQGVRNLKRCLEIIYTKLNLYRLMKEGSTLFNKEEILKVEFPFTVTKQIVDKLIKNGDNNSPPFGMYI
jgi:ATP-dependent Lon protease